jgi:hypothetical protein
VKKKVNNLLLTDVDLGGSCVNSGKGDKDSASARRLPIPGELHQGGDRR